MATQQITTLTSRDFVHNVSAAKRTVIEGATVIVTDRGKPTMAILPIAEYRRLTKTEKNLVEMLHMPEGDGFDMDFEPIRIGAKELDA